MLLWYQEATVCYVYLADVPREGVGIETILLRGLQVSGAVTLE